MKTIIRWATVLPGIGLCLSVFDAPAKKLYQYQDERGIWHFST